MSIDVEKEIKLSDEIWKSSDYSELRTQMTEDFKYAYDDDFKMGTDKGKWETVKDTSPRVLKSKVSGLLSASTDYISILTTDEDSEERKEIAKTERAAIGMIDAADENLMDEPGGKSIKDAAAESATVFGGVIGRAWCYEQDGELVPDFRIYMPINCTFEDDRKERRYYKTVDALKKEYDKTDTKYGKFKFTEKGTTDDSWYTKKGDKEYYLCREIWYNDNWFILAGDQVVEEHEIPDGIKCIKVATCGNAPIMQFVEGEFNNTLKYAFQSVYHNNRDLFDRMSEALSMIASRGKESAKIRGIIEYDGSQSGGGVPKEIEKLGYGSEDRNNFILLDTSKGQKFSGLVTLPNATELLELYRIYQGLNILAGIDPIAWGNAAGNPGASGALAAQLRSAALEFMIPYKRCVEEILVWFCQTGINQFKNMEFKKARFRGFDVKKTRFNDEIKAEEVTDKERFLCNLRFDSLRDEAIELGNFVTATKAGAYSARTGRIKHNLVDDPDKEEELIMMERSNEDPVMRYRSIAYHYADQAGIEFSDEERKEEAKYLALYFMEKSKQIAIQEAERDTMPPQTQPVPPNPATQPQTQSALLGVQ